MIIIAWNISTSPSKASLKTIQAEEQEAEAKKKAAINIKAKPLKFIQIEQQALKEIAQLYGPDYDIHLSSSC